jgi:8-oxo-dGTP diphosphatase
MHPLEVGAALITRDGKYLITQRKEGDSFGGFWELPGGKREPGETMEQCVIRELKEELDLDVILNGFFRMVVYPYPHRLVKLNIYWSSIPADAEPKSIECQAYAWVDPKELPAYHFPDADQELVQELSQKPAGMEYFPRQTKYSEEYLEGIRLFNRGFYFECHELLEEVWHPSEGRDRLHYQALIQAAVALRHFQHHNWTGALGLYQKALEKWDQLPPVYLGLDLKQLREELDIFFEQVQKAGPAGIKKMDMGLVPKIPMPQ